MGIVGIGLGVLTAMMASRKGYNGFLWFLGGGLIGLIVLAFLPDTNNPMTSIEEQNRQRTTGNIVGGVMAAVCVSLALFLIFGSGAHS